MIIHNPEDAPIKDYPIQDPETKKVNLWSILPGETLDFPDYVAKYLLEVYGFLQRIMTQAEVNQEAEEQKLKDEGKKFSQVKVVDSAPPSQPVNVEPPAAEEGFTNKVFKAQVEKPKPVYQDFICPLCQEACATPEVYKEHFVAAHAIPDQPEIQPQPEAQGVVE